MSMGLNGNCILCGEPMPNAMRCGCKDSTSAEIERLYRAQIRAEALEEAAREAWSPNTIYFSAIDINETPECEAVRKQIASRIRALKGE